MLSRLRQGRKQKRGIAALIMFSFLTLSFLGQLVTPSSVLMAADDDFTITTYVTNPPGQVTKDSPFSLTISLLNKTGKSGADLNGLRAAIKDCSFYSGSGPQTISWSGNDGTVIFPLTYDGGSRTDIELIITDENETDPAKKVKKVGGNPIKLSIATPTNTSNPIDPVDTSKYIPVLQFSGRTQISAEAGKTLGFNVTIKNNGSHSARDIYIKPELGENSPFIPTSSDTAFINYLGSNSTATVYFKLDISPYAEEKIYPLKFNFEYFNYFDDFFGGSASPRSDYVYIKVTNPNTPPRLSISSVTSAESQGSAPAKAINTRLTISNLGNLPAQDIKITLLGLKDDGFGLYQDSNLRRIARINGNDQTVVEYSLLPSGKIGKGNYGLTAKIEYKDQSGKEYSDEHQFFIDVQKGVSVNSVPKIILNQYSSEPAIVKAGENFVLNLSFQNTSSSKTVSNIKVFFTVPDGGANSSGSVFTPVNSSNTIYIDEIPPKGIYRQTLDFYTIPDAVPKTYTLTANFEYEDENGESYEAKELIGIPVSQQLKLETSELILPSDVFLGEPVPVSVEFYNTGKARLANLMLKLEGDFDIQNGSYFVGNFEVGASDYFEGIVMPNAPGAHEGTLVISYEDPSGEQVEIRKDFTLNVMEMSIPEMPPGFDTEGMKAPGGKLKTMLGLGLGILVLIIAVIVLWKKGLLKKGILKIGRLKKLISNKKGLPFDE